MTVAEPIVRDEGITDEDRARMAFGEKERARAELEMLAAVMAKLRGLTISPGSSDREFIRTVCCRESAALSPEQRTHVQRLAWHYRRWLPRHCAPRSNPDDPVVMQGTF